MPRVIITVPEKNPQPYRFQLDRKVVSLGRGSDNDIVIDSGSVSGRHAEMHRVEGGYELADLGSTNGIKYDGARERVLPLRSGMSVKLGDVSFDFSLTEEELETLGREKPANESPVRREQEIPRQARDQEDAPKPRPKAVPRPSLPPAAESGVSAGMIVLFLILAASAFFAGLEIRHRKETGGQSFLNGLSSAPEAQKPDPQPAGGAAE
ncbi:FHA domain-containing protein [Akkermansiaceae bacterium]|nr:FHA domain-containing protein [Akkermansiaceae bacterium]